MFAIPPWFGARKALGVGVIMLGASIGSIITPILLEHLVRSSGFPWAVRSAAFLYLFLSVGQSTGVEKCIS